MTGRLAVSVAYLMAILLLPTREASGVEIIAHRGASYDAPENTLASVKLGWQQNADAVEIDIQRTSDGKIVLMHDKTTKRTAGGEDTPVKKQTLAELRNLDVGSWKSPNFKGEPVPTLDEVLQTIPTGKRLFIEIKSGPEILAELKRVLDASGTSPEQTPIIAFDYATVRQAKALMPKVRVYWLVELKKDERSGELSHTAAELIKRTREAGLDGLDLGGKPMLNAAFVREIKDAGLGIYVWTINDMEKARDYEQIGDDGITTDRPGAMLEYLRGRRN